MKELKYFTRNVYGELRFYPGNKAAVHVCQMCRTKTIPEFAFYHLKELGFTTNRIFEEDANIEE